jgi:hypothetical protein
MAAIETVPQDTVSLYLDLAPSAQVDLEVAAKAAIEWARALKAAAMAVDPSFEYRVNLVAAEPGSNRWLAKVERSNVNQAIERAKSKWENTPLIFRMGIGLAVVIPITVIPTYDFYFGDDGFSEKQKVELHDVFEKASQSPTVKVHKTGIYKTSQRDRNIVGLGGGVPDRENWRPRDIIPSNRFAEGAGLFELEADIPLRERTVPQTLDVILVSPNLDNPRLAWVFRQEGIPGTIKASMNDEKFLAALESQVVRETLRTHIPMKIRLEIKQRNIDGEWVVIRRGRSVVEVISPETG